MQESVKLPAGFVDLQDLADSFAVSDDLERNRLIKTATPADIRRLVDEVWPRLKAINIYLDDHDDESAHLLGRLAESACEVVIEIGQPNL